MKSNAVCLENNIQIVEQLINAVGKMPHVTATRFERSVHIDRLRIIIQFEAKRIEHAQTEKSKTAYTLPGGRSDMRFITNPIRKICRKLDIDCSIIAPERCYVWRHSKNEFLGYASPEVVLEIM